MKPHIVTAFFDIGWKGLPGTDERSVSWYLERFKPLAKLNNPMTVYTSEALKPEIEKLLEGRETPAYIDTSLEGEVQRFSEVIAEKYADKTIQEPLTMSYIAVMWLKALFVENAAYKYSQATHTAWVDFGALRWYGKVEQTPIVPRAWEYEFADYIATFFESGGRLSGSTWVVPTNLASEFLHLFVYGAKTLAEKDGIIYDDEYVWGYLINNKLIPSIVLSLGAHNWFGAIHKYNGVNHD